MSFSFSFLKSDYDSQYIVELPAGAAVSPESAQARCPLAGCRAVLQTRCE